MLRNLFALVLVGLALTVARAEEDAPAKPVDPNLKNVDVPLNQPLTTPEVLDTINKVNAYQKPKLSLKLNERYARTADDLVPFGGVEPFKRHFLLQMEYAGAGRAIPEPEHVDSVKIGFVGPIMSTVSVATGGKSHEENLGLKMLQGTVGHRACQCGRRIQRPQHPIRTGHQERQRIVGSHRQ